MESDVSKLRWASLGQAAHALRTSGCTADQLTAAALAAVADEDPSRHAFVRVDASGAMAQADLASRELAAGLDRGPLHGIPVAVKDNMYVEHQVSSNGCPAYLDFVAPANAVVVQRLRAAGGVLLGALHLHEGALAAHHPDFGPPPASPFVPGMWPGGSSSGAGVAVAAGLCFAALGTDTGGSVRYPASLNGLTALKPTWGRLPTTGTHALAPDLDTVGPLCRNADDLRTVFAVLEAARHAKPRTRRDLAGVRIGVDWSHVRRGVSSEIVQALGDVLTRMRSLGAQEVVVDLPSMTEPLEAQIALMARQCAETHASRYAAAPEAFGQLADVIEDGLRRPADTAVRAAAVRRRFSAAMARLFATVDAVLLPVLPLTGIRYAAYDDVMATHPDLGRFTAPYNLGRQPVITFPAGRARDGMPIGVQLVGPHGRDESLIDWVAVFQEKHPAVLTPPPVDPPAAIGRGAVVG